MVLTQDSAQLQSDLCKLIAREFRNPLYNMKMAIDILQRDLMQNQNLAKSYEASGRVARCFTTLQDECERQLNLINDLLDLQRLENGTYPSFFTETVDLPTWLVPILAPIKIQVEQYRQTLEVQLANDLPLVATEPTSLRRILAELIKNACKHSPPGEKIILEIQSESHRLVISVKNTGAGIPEQSLSHIFDNFHYLSNSDQVEQSGIGLGLALTQKLVERLGGSIQAESRANATCFIVELPVDKAML